MRLIVALLLALTALVPGARAEDTRVAVLPWTAASLDMKPYSEPVATGIVERLRKRTGLVLQAVTGKSRVPEKVDLVIDGRLLSKAGKVSLEARIRDPELGQAMATQSTRWAPLSQLDTLAGELASALAPALESAVRQKKSVEKALAVRRRPAEATRSVSSTRTVQAERPAMIVVRVAGRAAGGAVEVTGPATLAAVELAERLGFEAVPVGDRGLLTEERARQLARAHDAGYALVLYARSIDFSWRRVLTARGRVRVALLSSAGETVFDRTFMTDTLVGSRGDRHVALIYFVVEQAGLMAEPMLRKKIR